MKSSLSLSVILALTLFLSGACSKKDTSTENADCKTCKAFANSDAPFKEEQVCTEAAESSFRARHKEQEVSCN